MRTIEITTRWSIKQVADNRIQLTIPESCDGVPILSNEFIEANKLSEAEAINAENKVLRAIAILE